MLGKRLIHLSKIVLIALVAACTPPPTASSSTPDQDLLYQTSTLSALSAGDFEGDLGMVGLRVYGDFGLGTFNALDGEMVMLDGVIYQIRDDGVATVASDSTQTPFAAVTFFSADKSIVVDEAGDCPQLQTQIDSQLPGLDKPYAVKVNGEFTSLKVRTPHKQSAPYPTLTDALADQAVFDSQKISGTMVGFRLPDYMANSNSAGYHFHFISGDKQHGGHVLACQAGRLMVQIDTIERIHIDLTPPIVIEPETIKYGFVLPLSGEYSWVGENARRSMIMVEVEVNNTGGINGTPLQFVGGDEHEALATEAAEAQRLIELGAVALLGPTSLAITDVIPLILENQIPMISPSAGTVELDRMGSDYFYRTVPSDSLGGRALALAAVNSAEYLGEEFERVVMMVTQAPAFVSFQTPIARTFTDAGKELAATIPLQPGAATYADAAQAALAYAPDLIILIGAPTDSAQVMQETVAAGYAGRWFFTQDQTTPEYISLATPELIEGSYGLMEIPAPQSAEQLAAFNKAYSQLTLPPGHNPLFVTNAYDAATVLALAMLRASIHDWEVRRETVNANIPLVANPGEGKIVVTSYGEGKEVLMAGGEINYQGISGPIDFDQYGNVSQPYGIFRVQNGAWIQISTISNELLPAALEAQ
jgi:neutral amino acid transport system substrate-binding protein